MNKLGINRDCRLCSGLKQVCHQINRHNYGIKFCPQFWEKGAKISFKFEVKFAYL